MKHRNRVKFLVPFLSFILIIFSINNAFSDAGNGAKLWADNCARCHNMRSPTEFNATQWKAIMAHMRARSGLTAVETENIYEFLINSPPATISKVQNENKKGDERLSGKTIYQQNCAACHGVDGKGAITGVFDLTGKNSALLKNSDAVLLKRIEEGFRSPGSTMAMPPKGGNSNLTHDELKAVLKYMKQTFSH